MTILEKNAELTTMLAYVEEHIDSGDLDPAANTLRKIGEHMAKWMIIDAGLWKEACTGRDGKVYNDPNFSRCIDLLYRNRRIDRRTRDEVFSPLRNYGNDGSHKTAVVEKIQVDYAFWNVEKYVTGEFLPKYPGASRIDILPPIKESQKEDRQVKQIQPLKEARPKKEDRPVKEAQPAKDAAQHKKTIPARKTPERPKTASPAKSISKASVSSDQNNRDNHSVPSFSTHSSSRENPKYLKRPKYYKWAGVVLCILAVFIGWKAASSGTSGEKGLVNNNGQNRIEYLNAWNDVILYADLFDLNTDGTPELICVTQTMKKTAMESGKSENELDDADLGKYICITGENMDTVPILPIYRTYHYEIPFGIYLNSQDNQYYIGYAGGASSYGDNGEILREPWFEFYQIEENSSYRIKPDELGTPPVPEWFQLKKEFPFDEQTTDFTALAGTVEEVRQILLSENK